MLDECLQLKERERGYCESEHILALVYALLDGASCLDDVQRLRDDAETQEVLQLAGVPHPTTLGDFLRRFKLEEIEQFEELLRELGKKTHKLDSYPKPKLTVDLDSKVSEKYGHQEGVELTYRKVKGFHPQFAFRADTTEMLFARLNPGFTYTAAGASKLLDKILSAVPEETCVLRLRAYSGWYM